MYLLRDKCKNFLNGKKRRYLILPIYILYVVVFVLILGVCTENLWDELIKWAHKNS
ncbi:hypothetical protein H8923_08815 [Romboutsia hominis]|uniref:Uncharacterized protein n=1 Tax=Romboutsia faecis TaxID=2764597 RepID=A0ABR7JPT0_9FIRM|nr:hypothetical protein [Romboutsia faecis]MBC5996860.1 hypothetical protein [Romboutsia faecis]